MNTRRWQIKLVEEPDNLPVRWRRARRPAVPDPPWGEQHASAALVAAFHLLARRGPGTDGWAASLQHDPIAFVLDATDNPVALWGASGNLVYQNRAAAELGIGRSDAVPLERFTAQGRQFERRCLRCHLRGADYVVEIIHELRNGDRP